MVASARKGWVDPRFILRKARALRPSPRPPHTGARPPADPHPPLEQRAYRREGFPSAHVHDGGVAEACTRPVGVLDMGFERVLAAPYRGDPPLGVVRAGLGGRPFRDDRYRSLPGRTEGETQPRDAASDDQIVGMPVHAFPPAWSPCRLTRGSTIY